MTSLAWFLWYGLKIGLTYEQTYTLPVGELRTLIAIQQIKYEGAKPRIEMNDMDIIPDLK